MAILNRPQQAIQLLGRVLEGHLSRFEFSGPSHEVLHHPLLSRKQRQHRYPILEDQTCKVWHGKAMQESETEG